MSFISKPFRVFVALLIAVPLGPGGLCCCLIGATDAMAAEPELAPPSSCCSQSTPVAPPPPDDSGTDLEAADCECPVRDSGFLPERVHPVPVAPAALAVEITPISPPANPARVDAPLPPSPAPPPKIALHLELSVLIS